MSLSRGFLCLSAAAIMAPAFASFELMFLPQAGTSRIVRFDPENGVSLGAFGQIGVTPSSSFVNATSNGRATFSNATGTITYDYSTGAQLSYVNYPSGKMRVPVTGVGRFGTFGNITFDHRANDGAAITTLSASAFIAAIAPHSDTVGTLMCQNGANDLVYQRFNGSTLEAATTALTAANWTPNSLGQGQPIASGANTVTRLPFRSNAGAVSVLNVTQSSTSVAFTFTGVSGTANFSATATLQVLPSHIGFYVIGDDVSGATVTRIQHYAPTGVLLGNYTTTAVDVPTNNWGGAIVLTPEPGSLAVLALGLFALSRKRKS